MDAHRISFHPSRMGFDARVSKPHDNQIIAGHGRLEASKLAGLNSIPIIRLNISQAQSKALNIWDHRSSDLTRFDDKLLGLALEQVVSLDIDIADAGFSVAEADCLIEAAVGESIPIPPTTMFPLRRASRSRATANLLTLCVRRELANAPPLGSLIGTTNHLGIYARPD